MNGVGLKGPAGPVHYPRRDGKPMGETGIHVLLMVALIEALRRHFADRANWYIIGNMLLYYEEGNPKARRSPDVMVIKGAPSLPERESWRLWEEKAAPCVVIELTSDETAEEDKGPKKELYRRLGVREYFLYDPKREHLPRPLVGYRLVQQAGEGNGLNGAEVLAEYEEMPPAADGGLTCTELGLRLVPDGQDLALVDYATGKRLPRPAELARRLDEALARIAELEREVEEADRRAQQTALRTQQAEESARQSALRAQQAEESARQSALQTQQAEESARQSALDARQAIERADHADRRAVQATERADLSSRRAQEANERAQQALDLLGQQQQLLDELRRSLAGPRPHQPPPPAAPEGGGPAQAP
jgi:Uma2 family endonuclease